MTNKKSLAREPSEAPSNILVFENQSPRCDQFQRATYKMITQNCCRYTKFQRLYEHMRTYMHMYYRYFSLLKLMHKLLRIQFTMGLEPDSI